jgi:hypothetical protein
MKIISIIDLKEDVTIEFYVGHLATAPPSELTNLIHKCEQKKPTGSILVFLRKLLE